MEQHKVEVTSASLSFLGIILDLFALPGLVNVQHRARVQLEGSLVNDYHLCPAVFPTHIGCIVI